MKRLALVMVLVLAFSGMALATNNASEVELYAEVEILPWANITIISGQDTSFLTEGPGSEDHFAIQGQAGVYSNNAGRLLAHLEANIGKDSDKTYPTFEYGGSATHSANIARFMVESNHDVVLTPSVNWENWMTYDEGKKVPTLFYVSPRDENGSWYSNVEDHLAPLDGIDNNIVSVFGNVEGFADGSWTQGFRYCTDQQYGVYFGFLLEKLTQVEARPDDPYQAVITITVGADV